MSPQEKDAHGGGLWDSRGQVVRLTVGLAWLLGLCSSLEVEFLEQEASCHLRAKAPDLMQLDT